MNFRRRLGNTWQKALSKKREREKEERKEGTEGWKEEGGKGKEGGKRKDEVVEFCGKKRWKEKEKGDLGNFPAIAGK